MVRIYKKPEWRQGNDMSFTMMIRLWNQCRLRRADHAEPIPTAFRPGPCSAFCSTHSYRRSTTETNGRKTSWGVSFLPARKGRDFQVVNLKPNTDYDGLPPNGTMPDGLRNQKRQWPNCIPWPKRQTSRKRKTPCIWVQHYVKSRVFATPWVTGMKQCRTRSI